MCSTILNFIRSFLHSIIKFMIECRIDRMKLKLVLQMEYACTYMTLCLFFSYNFLYEKEKKFPTMEFDQSCIRSFQKFDQVCIRSFPIRSILHFMIELQN